MTIDELKAIAAKTLDWGVQWMLEHGDLAQMFYLVRHDGTQEVIQIDGEVTNSGRQKDFLAADLRRRLATGNYAAVLMLSDTFFASISPEKELIRRKLGLNVEQAAAAGLCDKHEAVMCTVESSEYQQQSRQEYKREGEKIVLDGTVKTMTSENPSYKSSGRFFRLFQRAP
jgi:hypothetical protein